MISEKNFEDWEIDQYAPQEGKRHTTYNPRARSRSLDDDKNDVLRLLSQFDIWDERLLSDLIFGNTVEKVLEPIERFILEMKIEKKSEKYIVSVLNERSKKKGHGSFTLDSLSQRKSDIKRKLRDGFNTRLPGWIRGKKFKTKEEKQQVENFYKEHPEFLREE